jgi:predicted small lipoprotein YifL
LQEAKTKMKRLVLLILVLLLLVDLAEDGCLGKATLYLPSSSAKTSLDSSYDCPGSGQSDFGCELATSNVPGRSRYGEPQPVSLNVPPTLQISYCCHFSSAGGIPL